MWPNCPGRNPGCGWGLGWGLAAAARREGLWNFGCSGHSSFHPGTLNWALDAGMDYGVGVSGERTLKTAGNEQGQEECCQGKGHCGPVLRLRQSWGPTGSIRGCLARMECLEVQEAGHAEVMDTQAKGKSPGCGGEQFWTPETALPHGDVCDSSLLGPCVKGPF